MLRDGTIIRGLRVRFEGGKAVQIDADENVEALRPSSRSTTARSRLGELALVDRQGRIGPLGTVFYDTLLDENAASHIALGNGFPFLVEEADAARVNTSGTHVDFMIGSRSSRSTASPRAASACPSSATATGRSEPHLRSDLTLLHTRAARFGNGPRPRASLRWLDTTE